MPYVSQVFFPSSLLNVCIFAPNVSLVFLDYSYVFLVNLLNVLASIPHLTTSEPRHGKLNDLQATVLHAPCKSVRSSSNRGEERRHQNTTGNKNVVELSIWYLRYDSRCCRPERRRRSSAAAVKGIANGRRERGGLTCPFGLRGSGGQACGPGCAVTTTHRPLIGLGCVRCDGPFIQFFPLVTGQFGEGTPACLVVSRQRRWALAPGRSHGVAGHSLPRADEATAAGGGGSSPGISARRASGCGASGQAAASLLQLRVRAGTLAARRNARTDRNHMGIVSRFPLFPYATPVTFHSIFFDVCPCRLKR